MKKEHSKFKRIRTGIALIISATSMVLSYNIATWLFDPKVDIETAIGNPAKESIAFDVEEYSKVKIKIDSIWERIEFQLRKRAPRELALLREPASLEEVESLEQILGCNLPYDVRASLQRHNGSVRNRVPCSLFILNSVDVIAKLYRSDMVRLTELADYSVDSWAIEDGASWPSELSIADTGLEWDVIANCSSGKISLRMSSEHSTVVADNWEQVLTAWAKALEGNEYKILKDGNIFIEDWAGLNPW